jgi:hypothetical protein
MDVIHAKFILWDCGQIKNITAKNKIGQKDFRLIVKLSINVKLLSK